MSATPTCEREVVLTRVFDAPLELVWKVWTEAEHVANWWGPHCFTNPHCEWEATPGGKILIHMRSPEGGVHPMSGQFVEVVDSERLVFTTAVDDAEGAPILKGLTTVTFAKEGDKTQLTVRSSAAGFVDFASQMLDGMEMGWSQSLEKMADQLGGLK